ncbi:LLM class flavin-dependent oxidoreductase [Nocardia jiangxiensis]|uniref:LLM class flavin-dependent oxidoreductase n=1 Tax=Nocardia jiangxiensis TaxID=282685 RepID=UPI0002DB8E45|nr:LLM class flavin-dependent oxidoreductase [Nocardia jiangxiensis]
MPEIHGVYPPHADPAARPLEAYVDQTMPMKNGVMLGLFLPNESWAEFPTLAPTTTEWTYEYNRAATLAAEAAGFHFALPAGRWKGLQGDHLNWRGASLDTVTLTAGLLEATSRITILTTIHTNVYNPVVAAKLGADMDQIGEGRWGMNIVSGWGAHEFEQMGVPLLDHKERYVYTAEWLDIVRGLWNQGVFSYEGKHFTIQEATAWPRPAQRPRPLLVNAGQSYTGMSFSARQVDYAFSYPKNIPTFRKICAEVGRNVGFIGNKRIILGDTDAEATRLARAICDKADKAALRAHLISAGAATEETIGDLLKSQADYDKYFIDDAMIGDPDTVARQLSDWILEHRPNGVCLQFYNCIDDLRVFAEEAMPRMAKYLGEHDYPLLLNRG